MAIILLWILFGAVAGWIASLLAGTETELGLPGNIVVGILGAIIGGLLIRLMGGTGFGGFNLYSMFVAILGASVLLFGFRSMRRY